jgi:CubicO group peptidase (beta-lactamase class C family)
MPMLETSRSLLQRTATAIGWWTSPDRSPGEPAPLPHTLETIAESAIAGGYAAGVGLGFCLPIKCPASAGLGLANLETATAVDEATVFQAGGIARQLTAVAILLLAERSELRLDNRIDMFLPGEAGADAIRIADLLVADDAAYALLGRILEHVTGEDFADFVTATLLLPAGMTGSGFAGPAQVVPHRASGYRLVAERAHDFRNTDAGRSVPAADGLHTTAGDLLLWNRALYSGRLLARSTVETLTAASAEGSGCAILAPFLGRHGRGYGVEVGRLFGRRAFWQRGQTPGFDAWLFHFPDDRADLALLANTEQGAATILEPMLRAILRV